MSTAAHGPGIARTDLPSASRKEHTLDMAALLRWAPVAGIIFVVCMVVGSKLIGDVPAPDASAHTVTNYLADGHQHTLNIIGAYFWVVGALAFQLFLMRLRIDMRKAEGGASPLSHLAFAAGVAFSAVWMASAAIYASVANAIDLRNAPVSSIDLVRVLPPTGRLLLLLGGGFSGILVLVATATVILKTGFLPRWLAWLGIAFAITLLVDVLYLTIWPFWGWVLIACIVMLVRQKGTTATT